MDQNTRIKNLYKALESRILVLDGATGTAIQGKNLTAEDFGGPELEGCNEYLVITRPDIICDFHENYLEAGADIIETNTFGATPLVLEEYGLGARAYEINVAAAKLAREACEKYDTADKPRFVAGSIGPTTKAISVTGGITFESLEEHFYIQSKALLEGGVDYFLIETCQDTRNIKAALLAMDRLFNEVGFKIPVAVSGTIEPMGTMLAGQSVEALFASLANRDLLYIGLNCATGPEFMTDPIRTLATLSSFCVACVPNAGLPDEYGNYLETPQMVAQVLSRFVENGWINLLGGCCGTGPDHIKALSELAKTGKPRVPKKTPRSFLSGVDYLEITDEMRPVIVGERTNVIGSKKFKTLISEEKFEEASDIGRLQIKNGAQIIDICLANPDREEMEDMRRFLEFAAKKIRAPWMIDSTDEKVIAMALTYSQGKAIVNSINLEDGEERYEKVIPLAKKFGAALVVGTIDDNPSQGMAVTRQRKLAVAERSYKLLTEKYGILPEDIYWDPLVFPCATGDRQYVGSAVETIEGIRLIKQKYPRTKTVLGISNVSFGLPPAGREVLNSVFLYDCVKAGLDLAIVNSEKLVRYASIPPEEIKLAEDLLYNRGGDPIATFAAHFRERKSVNKADKQKLPLMERLPRYIIEGSKDGLADDLNEILKTMKPIDIINGPLMQGMDEVGKLFNANQLIVAEVLQSAEAMKSAVACLEPFMEKSETAARGKVILATVKGDVHDIGKNLVDIILSNNGFEVVNLGIKVPPEQLITAIREHNPDIVGLSGLLVKSAQQMVVTADDFAKAGVDVPMLVGGAALSSNFVDKNISKSYSTGTVAYASDAMNGLELAKVIVDPEKFEKLKKELLAKRTKLKEEVGPSAEAKTKESPKRIFIIQPLPFSNLPIPSDFNRHVIRNTPIEQVWKYINPLMLYGRHLGIKGGVLRKLEKGEGQDEPKAKEIWNAVQAVKKEYANTVVMQPSAVYQFFKASSEGNSLFVYPEKEKPVVFNFPRQQKGDGLCLADYTLGKKNEEVLDSVALFVVSVGREVRELAEKLKNSGDYLRSHILQALALESAEAYAELLHAQLRKAWGFPDAVDMTMMDRFQAKYRGKRYSFGYPACPRLEDQALLWTLLKPEEIGVQLTEGFMMDPEASVSALVFHHPQATYFSVGFGKENQE
ncbi:MAG: methionine synthase [Deltaproteobacteria bacterium]|nr:methionine synthase [Deltaproteobacteria bacterium]